MENMRRFAVGWASVLVVVAGVFTIQQTFGGYLVRKPLRTQFPGRELARTVEHRWRQLAGGAPLTVVAGDVWLAGNVAFYGDDRPSVFIDADTRKSPWITPELIARGGAVFVWQDSVGVPPWLGNYPAAQRQPPIELSYVPALRHAPARLGWAILLPKR
jgi:hypothetical protein